MKKILTSALLLTALTPFVAISYHYGKKTAQPDALSAYTILQEQPTTSALPACHPTQDPLIDYINEYRTTTKKTTQLQQTQQKLNLKIYGTPTTKDLEELLKAAEEYKNTTSYTLSQIGIKKIIIFSSSQQQEVDYIGLAIPYINQLRLFTNNILEKGIAYHEFTHFHLNYLENEKPLEYYQLLIKWNLASGLYNKVIPIQKRGIIDIKSYTDDTTGAKYGYLFPYGGKSFDEDICTYVAAIKTSPQYFKEIKDPTKIYQQKIEILSQHNLITSAEKEIALHYLNFSKQQPQPLVSCKYNLPP
jgi:hypothetical protein